MTVQELIIELLKINNPRVEVLTFSPSGILNVIEEVYVHPTIDPMKEEPSYYVLLQ